MEFGAGADVTPKYLCYHGCDRRLETAERHGALATAMALQTWRFTFELSDVGFEALLLWNLQVLR